MVFCTTLQVKLMHKWACSFLSYYLDKLLMSHVATEESLLICVHTKKPISSVSSTSSPFNMRTLQQKGRLRLAGPAACTILHGCLELTRLTLSGPQREHQSVIGLPVGIRPQRPQAWNTDQRLRGTYCGPTLGSTWSKEGAA